MPRESRRLVRSWGVLSSLAAPAALIGGWTVAAAVQRPTFDSVTSTISALAATDADARWLMTGALVLTGGCHVATAAALTSARPAGRVMLAAGGLATAGVAAFPLPAATGRSAAHTVAAGLAFGLLASWPAFGGRAGAPAWTLRANVNRAASLVLLGAVAAFLVTLEADAPPVGLTERVAAGSQALWPLLVVLGAWRAQPTGAAQARAITMR